MAKSKAGWQKKFFDVSFYNPATPAAISHAGEEVSFILSVLGLRKGAAILDVCCGPGRHSVRFAKKGFRVTGLDFSAAYLAEARKAAAALRVKPVFVPGDMRDMPFSSEFDAAVCLFTSFGYFGDKDNMRALKSVCGALKPGGLFLIDVIDRLWFEKNFTPRRWEEMEDGSYMLYEDRYSQSKRTVRSSWTRICPGRKPVTRSFTLRMYRLSELKSTLAQAGMKPRASWSGFGQGRNGNRLVVLAEKI